MLKLVDDGGLLCIRQQLEVVELAGRVVVVQEQRLDGTPANDILYWADEALQGALAKGQADDAIYGLGPGDLLLGEHHGGAAKHRAWVLRCRVPVLVHRLHGALHHYEHPVTDLALSQNLFAPAENLHGASSCKEPPLVVLHLGKVRVRLQEIDGPLDVPLAQLVHAEPEAVAVHLPQDALLVANHSGRTVHVVKHGQLSEGVLRPQLLQVTIVDDHGEDARLDDVAAVPLVALLEDDFVLASLDHDHVVDDGVALVVFQAGKEEVPLHDLRQEASVLRADI
mmetsp:Transcript_105402/g.325114  ORF Transcript_105402/g.325114 Transcript_105402/m.325114 type:complete len:282 (+) Transcript_105402:1031-1876(+)